MSGDAYWARVGSFIYEAVLRHVRQYEGDMAIVQFINMDWAAKFRGGNSWLRGAGWIWGRK